MTLGGWLVMLGSIGLVTGLLVFCVLRILRTPDAPRHVHWPSDPEPHEKAPRP